MRDILSNLNNIFKFMIILVFILWEKSVFAYYFDFSLGVQGLLQNIILLISPLGTSIILLSFGLYFRRSKIAYFAMTLIYLIESIFLYSNVLYYREFTNFISLNTILSSAKAVKSLGPSVMNSIKYYDFVYLIDVLFVFIILFIMIRKKKLQLTRKLNATAWTIFGVMIFSFNLALAEMNRPQLLTRMFDQTYIVKYLGLNTFFVYDSIKTVNSDRVRNNTENTSIDGPLKYQQENYAKPNQKYFGVARKKNLIIIHLESFQQFLINFKVNGQEVTPFLNSLYSDNNTLSYSNFFHQVGQGKTSDAETMLETGLFGLPEGSFLPQLGPSNTFQAAPAILNQSEGYTSAVFHGNVASFYSRDKVYPNFGYNYFFDQKSFNTSDGSSVGFGLKDKLMFAESTKYLEQLQQPFYVKYITLTNHYPFDLPAEDNDGFVTTQTKNSVVNNYFLTAHYLDSSLKEFFNYLKKSGLYDKSMIVLYGDHYGISNDKNPDLAPLLGYSEDQWTDFNNTQLQRVPFMIHMKGLKGGVKDTYGGEIDVLPTLLHLTGVNSKDYLQLGEDLLSKDHNQIVSFRNGSYVTPEYTVLKKGKGSYDVYLNSSGEKLDLTENKILSKKIENWGKQVDQRLKISDKINNQNLLRFYTPSGFVPVDPNDDKYNYLNQMDRMLQIRDEKGTGSTSLYSKNDNDSTTNFYDSDAPEFKQELLVPFK
ncbi:LTA synthase family protein [Companilactobacillus kedongensis]|uniref:LTA synthase family protein n=1 Tax=Companilactobacillus kedongensis TaxID=2486004 RepID=UPI000F7BA8F5|nr:LTA synthase family protein [Companilactobacillus kedongensis]